MKPPACFALKASSALLAGLTGEVRNNLESLGSMVTLGPVQSGKTWASFTVQVSDGRASRVYTLTVEEE